MLAASIVSSADLSVPSGFVSPVPVKDLKRPLTVEIMRCFTANSAALWVVSRLQVIVLCSSV